MSNPEHTLDAILIELGQFGRYQCFLMTLFSISVIIYSAIHISFVFAAKDLEYRCKIPECDLPDPIYDSDWLQHAIPFTKGEPVRCEQYRYIKTSNSTNSSCSKNNFNHNLVDSCNEFVYKTDTITIVNDFDIRCSSQQWKLTAIGTLNGAGLFVGLPISGIFSDRYGRKITLIIGLITAGVVGVVKSFATSYYYYAICEFLDSALSAGVYMCAFILGVELVGPKGRVMASTIISCSYAVGEVLIAAIAWHLESWRPLVRIVYGLNFIVIIYYWLAPESIRWLLSNDQPEKAKQILKTAARVNGKEIKDELLNMIGTRERGTEITRTNYPIRDIFKSTILVLRFINSCFCWITCAFLFYGLTLNSVALSSNSYLDFILTSLVEIPAYCLVTFVVDRFGRRICQCLAFLLTSVSCIAFIFISPEYYWLKLTAYLLGKFGATIAFSICYILSSEIFPTYLRHSLMSFGSMFGRIGAMISPQMPLLENIWQPLPLILYAVMATIAGFLSLLFPETVNTKLPDTIEEAEMIGRKK